MGEVDRVAITSHRLSVWGKCEVKGCGVLLAVGVLTDDLWGGTLTELTFNPAQGQCALRIEVVDAGSTSSHTVRCEDISEFGFFSSIPQPWTYAEVTQIALTFDDTGSYWLLDVMLWSEDAGLVLRCTDVFLDDRRLVPGDDLQ